MPMRSSFSSSCVCVWIYLKAAKRKLNKSTVIEIRNWRPGFVRTDCWTRRGEKKKPSVDFVSIFNFQNNFFDFLFCLHLNQLLWNHVSNEDLFFRFTFRIHWTWPFSLCVCLFNESFVWIFPHFAITCNTKNKKKTSKMRFARLHFILLL